MEKNKIKALDKLLAIKSLKDKVQNEPIRYKIEGCDEELVINRLSEKKCWEIINQNVKDDTPILELWDTLIYEAMPELRTKEVLEAFESTDNPIGVVAKIFSMGDRVAIGQELKKTLDGVNLERLKN